jgi:membrane protease YdiL (CAAX protease family)
VAADRLTGSDNRALLLWVVLGILGALYAYKYFFRAFPEASVNFQVSREEALSRAQKFVIGLGEDLGGYRSAITFSVDDNAKVYLERQLGLQQANKLMSSELNIWYWHVRFFRPQQEEEFTVSVSPAGNIVGYEHKVPEARAGPSLGQGDAQMMAKTFLGSTLGMNLSGWDYLPEEANSKQKPGRMDWEFTWEKHGFRAKDAPYRLQVTVQGDKIGASGEFLQVPEAWERGYKRLRSGNDTLTLVFTLPYLLLLGMAVWLGIQMTKSRETTWSPAIKLGALAAVLLFLQALNDWPLWGAEYVTNNTYSTFILQQIARALLIAVASALTITLVLPAAEPLYRNSQPGRMTVSKIFTLSGLRSKEFFSSAVVGLCLAAVHIGFIVAFYLFATSRGAWAPQELNYSDSVNTAFPWISGVAIGLLASMNEEFTFRLFAIPFFMRFTRSRWIAVIVPAFLWGFLHSNYPQEPAYIRGIEIGIIGIVAGMVMLRWGIIATLIWHYTVDALLVGLLLIRSNSLYFKLSGLVVAAAALAPLLFACFSCLLRGGFETSEDLVHRAPHEPEIDHAGEPVAAAPPVSSSGYTALAPRMIAVLAICLFAGGVLAWRLKPPSVGDYLKLSLDARTARARADEIMRQRGLDPNSYYHATIFADIADPVVNEFLRQRVGVAGVNAIYCEHVPAALWRVRYFRDSQPEEYAVILKPDGSLHSVRHTIAEETPGASLTKEVAEARAEKFLREEKKLELKDWNLVESSSDKRPHRIDHTLTWEENRSITESNITSSVHDPNTAHARIDVQVFGAEVTNYRTYIKIPGEWRRKQDELTLFRAVYVYVIPILYFVGLGLTALVFFLKSLKTEAARSIPWRTITLWSILGFCGYLVVFVLGNRIPNFLNAYNTAIPLKVMFGGITIGALLGAPLYFGMIALLFGMAWFFSFRAFGVERLPALAQQPANYFRDAVWIGLGGGAVLLGLARLLAAASTHWPTLHRASPASFGSDFDALLPAASILGGTLLRGLLYTGFVAAAASFLAAHVRQPGLRLLLFLIGALALTGGSWGNPSDLAKQFLAQFILLGVLVLGVRYFVRFNLLGCFLVVAGTSLVAGAAELLAQPDSFYRANGNAVLLALILLFAWPLIAWRMRRSAHPV